MPRYEEQRDYFVSRSGPRGGAQVEIRYTYRARNKAFHKAMEKRSEKFFSNFRRSYSQRVAKRTGRLSRGFDRKTKREYGREVVVNEVGRRTQVPYAFIYEYGGRGLHHKGTRRSGQIRRVFKTERRKLSQDVKKLVEDIYGD